MNLKKNNEIVSIIIVNWNGKKWLKKCLDSLEKQTYKFIEIIIVDNNSTDGSLEFVRKEHPKVSVIENSGNLGYPRAVNIGIEKSRGEYLALLNNDIWVKNEFIEMLFTYYTNNKFDVISPIVKAYDGNNSIIRLPSIDPFGSPAYFYSVDRKDKMFYLSSSYFCTKKLYKETLGFDDNYFAYYEDVDWFWRLQLLEKKIDYAEDVFIYHAGAGSLGKGIQYKMFLYRNQNALQTLIKNYSLISLFLVLPLYLIQNIIEIIFFLILFKFDIAYSYIQGWWFNIINFSKIMKKRNWIQKRRKVSDLEIIKKMYWGPAKLRMLINHI